MAFYSGECVIMHLSTSWVVKGTCVVYIFGHGLKIKQRIAQVAPLTKNLQSIYNGTHVTGNTIDFFPHNART